MRPEIVSILKNSQMRFIRELLGNKIIDSIMSNMLFVC